MDAQRQAIADALQRSQDGSDDRFADLVGRAADLVGRPDGLADRSAGRPLAARSATAGRTAGDLFVPEEQVPAARTHADSDDRLHTHYRR